MTLLFKIFNFKFSNIQSSFCELLDIILDKKVKIKEVKGVLNPNFRPFSFELRKN